MTSYVLNITVKGDNQAGGMLNSLKGGLAGVATVAGGILAAGLLQKIGAGIVGMGRAALDAYSSHERLGLSLQTLVAREIAHGQTIQEVTTSIRHLSEEEKLRLDQLTLKYAGLQSQLGDVSVAYNDAITEFGAGSMEALAQSVAMRELQGELAGVGSEMEALRGIEGSVISSSKDVTVNTMSMAEALQLSGSRAQELIRWIELLAIKSPFDEAGVAAAFRTSMAYGFTTEEAQRLTKATIDFTAATGAESDAMARIALALGQVKAKGKLAGQEVLQLVNAGVDVNSMLKSMGFTLNDVSNGLVDADTFMGAFLTTMETDFAGAAERQANSWSGLLTTIGEIKTIGLREIFAGAFKAAQPYVASVVGRLSNPEFFAKLTAIGEVIGGKVAAGLERFAGLWTTIKGLGIEGVLDAIGAKLLSLLPPWLLTQLGNLGVFLDKLYQKIVKDVSPGLDKLGGRFEIVATKLSPLLDQLGPLAREIVPLLTAGLVLLVENWDKIAAGIGAAASAFATARIVGWVIGIAGAVSGLVTAISGAGGLAGVLGSIVAVLGGPVTIVLALVAGAIALLAAAWANNWGGIRDTLTDVWVNTIQPALQELQLWFEAMLPKAIEYLGGIWKTELLPALQEVWGFITGSILPIFERVRGFIQDTLIPVFSNLISLALLPVQAAIGILAGYWQNVLWPALQIVWQFIQGSIIPILQTLVAGGISVVQTAVQALSTLWQTILLPALTAVWNFISQHLLPLFQGLVEFGITVLDVAVRLLQGAWENVLLPALEKVWGFISEHLLPIFQGIVDFIETKVVPVIRDQLQARFEEFRAFMRGPLSEAFNWVKDNILAPFQKALDAIGGVIDWITDRFKELTDALKNADMPWWAKEHSPSPFEKSLVHIGGAMRDLNRLMEVSPLGFGNSPFSSPLPAMAGGGAGGSGFADHSQYTIVNKNAEAAALTMAVIDERQRRRHNDWMGG